MQSSVYTLPPTPTARAIRERASAIGPYIDRLNHILFVVDGIPQSATERAVHTGHQRLSQRGKNHTCCSFGGAIRHPRDIHLVDRRRSSATLSQLAPRHPRRSGPQRSARRMAHFDDTLILANEGNFHFLQAGTPVEDTLRYLHDPKFGMVIARCRERFDLTIIDCGPVVPSPDPFALCKWVDGVLFAARYDFSRYPDIESARHKLAATGVPILAVVLNRYPIDDPPA